VAALFERIAAFPAAHEPGYPESLAGREGRDASPDIAAASDYYSAHEVLIHRKIRDNLAVLDTQFKFMNKFQVTVQPQGRTFEVSEDETILDAALRQNVILPYGCRSGNCGTCQVKLVSGGFYYPHGDPPGLTDDEDGMLICQAIPTSDLLIRGHLLERAAEIEPRVMPCKVHLHEPLAHDVMRVMLKLPDTQRLQFLAGQYLEFLLENGKRRAFSIANAPHDDEFIELHIRHVEGGAFTDFVFDSLKDKTVLRIEAPLGTFTLREESDRPMLFIAGGTGFAPIKGMLEHAFFTGIRRPMTLYWGVRSRRDLYLPDLPEEWMAEHDNFRFVPVLSEPDANWTGRTGFVHDAVLQDIDNVPEYDVYMAGPPVMVTSASDAFEQKGLSRDYMYSDAFEYAAPRGK
jgi:CDP-4-dehydro-6-deoxyglucose reductase